MRQILLMLFVLGSVGTTTVMGQQFTLSAPGLDFTSTAYLTDAKLDVIDAQGKVNSYVRDLSFDSADGQWRGYLSKESGRVLRWPASNTGNLQIGNPQAGGAQFSFSASRMRISPVGLPPGNAPKPSFPTIPPIGNGAMNGLGQSSLGGSAEVDFGVDYSSLSASDLFDRVIANPASRLPSPQVIHLVSYDQSGKSWAIAQRGARLGCIPQANSQASWWVTPAGPGMVRLQLYNNGQIWTVSAADRNNLRLDLVSQNPRQLWRITSGHLRRNFFALENAFFVGNFLTNLGSGNLGLQPMMALPTQMWTPLVPPANFISSMTPFWRNVSREIRPNAPLPPAEVELLNTGKYAAIVLIGDMRSGQQINEVRVEPGRSSTITVERDAGSTLVEVVETRTPTGNWNRQEYVTQIPPVSLYDLSVYEEFLQSIAIDRTGKSPNQIEDMNFMPKSLGLLVLPPGDALPERGQMDVYAQAKAANNAGAVRRMDPKRFEKEKPDPLESILEGLQRNSPPSSQPRSF